MGYLNTTTTSSQSQTGNRVATTYHQTGREWDPGWDKGPVLWRWVDRTWTEYSWVPYTFTPAKTKKELKIVGLKNAYLQPSSTPYGMTLKKFDTASYVDRAILQLKNETAGNVVVRDISIRGEPVYQIAGQNGFIWEYSDYDSIDKNGEQFKEIGNDFIFDAGQAESIGDFAWKLLKPHQVYTLALRGCQYQYQIGDVYTLNVNYSLDASSSQIELVNVDVEVIGVSFERSVGSVGSTMLACRVDLGAWSKTTSRRAQLVGTGQANNNTNRTNTVTVASSTYTGTADYYCDGTDDHVEIQKAIDDLYAIGGGIVQFTDGNFYISSKISLKTSVSIKGGKFGTIINKSAFADNCIYAASINGVSISDLKISNNDTTYNYDTIKFVSCSNINLSDINVIGGRYSGIYFDASSTITVADSIFYNIGFPTNSYCIEIRNSSEKISISNSQFELSDGSAIRIDGTNCQVSNCSIKNCHNGINVSKQSTIIGCTSYNNTNNGIYINGDRVTCSSNICYGNGDFGIYIETGADDCIVSSNNLYSNTDGNLSNNGANNIIADNKS